MFLQSEEKKRNYGMHQSFENCEKEMLILNAYSLAGINRAERNQEFAQVMARYFLINF